MSLFSFAAAGARFADRGPERNPSPKVSGPRKNGPADAALTQLSTDFVAGLKLFSAVLRSRNAQDFYRGRPSMREIKATPDADRQCAFAHRQKQEDRIAVGGLEARC